MLLRRLTHHMKDQNWFAVGLDVIVVIVGIFLGLQVQAWYDLQKARTEEKQLVSFLIADIEANNKFLEGIGDFYQRNIDANLWSLDLLQNGVLTEENRAQFERGLSRETATGALDTYLVSFDKENLDGVLDPIMRRSLANFMSEIKNGNLVTGNARSGINSLSGIIRSNAIVSREWENQPIVDYNFDTLKNNEQYRIAFKAIISRVQLFQRYNFQVLEQSRLMLKTLEAYQVGEKPEEVIFRNLDGSNAFRDPIYEF